MTERTMIVGGKEVRFLDEDDPRARVDRADQIPDSPDEASERAWWAEHTLSEEFWRNAESVPDSELPSLRGPMARPNEPVRASGQLPPGLAFGAGLIAGATLIAGAYLLYRLAQAGVSPADFVSTKAPYLRASA